MNKEQAFNLITEMVNCAIKRGSFSSVEQQALQEAYQVMSQVDKAPVVTSEEITDKSYIPSDDPRMIKG